MLLLLPLHKEARVTLPELLSYFSVSTGFAYVPVILINRSPESLRRPPAPSPPPPTSAPPHVPRLPMTHTKAESEDKQRHQLTCFEHNFIVNGEKKDENKQFLAVRWWGS